MQISKIRQIVEWVSNANLAHFELQDPAFTLRMSRRVTIAAPTAVAVEPVAVQAVAKAPKVAAMATVCGRFLSCHPLRDEPPVLPGAVIEPGMLVGLISVGELYLPVIATEGGTMAAFMVEDNQLVDYGTPLVSLVADE